MTSLTENNICLSHSIIRVFLIFFIALNSNFTSANEVALSNEEVEIVEEIYSQFRQFVGINKQFQSQGLIDSTNYLFVYRYGEELDFRRDIPSYLLEMMSPDPQYGGWLRDPDGDLTGDLSEHIGLMPLGQVYRDRLSKYNNLPIDTDGNLAQHFVIILDLAGYTPQSRIEVLESNGNLILPDVLTSTVARDNYLNSFQFVDRTNILAYSEPIMRVLSTKLNAAIQEDDDSQIFDDDEFNLITISAVIPEFSSIGNNSFSSEAASTAVSLNLRVEVAQASKMAGESWAGWLDLMAEIPNKGIALPNVGGQAQPPKGFQIIAEIINDFIGYSHDVDFSDVDCPYFVLTLYKQQAQDFYVQACTDYNQFSGDQKFKELAQRLAQYLDYITYQVDLINSEFNEDISSTAYEDIFMSPTNWRTFLATILSAYNMDVTDPSDEDVNVWMRDYFTNALSVEQREVFSIQQMFRTFFDLDQFSGLSHEKLTNSSIFFLDKFTTNITGSYFLDGILVNLFVPPGVDHFRKSIITSARETIFKSIHQLANGDYTLAERQSVFNILNANSETIWYKIITYNFQGYNNGSQRRIFLDDLYVLTLLVNPISNDVNTKLANTLITEVESETYEKSFTSIPNPTIYRTNVHDGSSYDVTIDDNDMSKVEFTFTEEFCRVESQWWDEQIQGYNPPLCSESYESKLNSLSFFEYMVPVKLDDYVLGASDCCFGDAINPCSVNGAVVPAFYFAGLKHLENVDDIKQAALDAVTVASVLIGGAEIYAGVRLMLAATNFTGRAFWISAMNVSYNVVDIATVIDPVAVKTGFGAVFGSSSDVAQIMADAGSLFVGLHANPAQKLDEIVSASAAGEITEELLENDEIRKLAQARILAQNVKKADAAGIGNDAIHGLAEAYTNEYDELLEVLARKGKVRDLEFDQAVRALLAEHYNGSVKIARVVSENSPGLGALILSARNRFGDNILQKLDELSEDALTKLAKDVNKVEGEDLFNFLGNAPDQATLFRRVDAWDVLTGPKKRLHLLSLQKMDDLLGDQSFLSKLDPDIAEAKNILQKISKHALNPLSGVGPVKLPNLDQHLENVRICVNNMHNKPGFRQKVLADIQKESFNIQKGTAHAFNDIKNLDPDHVESFDLRFRVETEDWPCDNCRFDVKMNDMSPFSHVEYKNVRILDQNGNVVALSISVDQMSNYLYAVSSLDELRYVFNGLRSTEIQAKEAMKKYLKNKAYAIEDALETLEDGKFAELFNGLSADQLVVQLDQPGWEEFVRFVKTR